MDILDLREYRDHIESQLSENVNLVTIRANFPGPDKRNIYTNFVSTMGLIDILKFIEIEDIYSSYSEEGLIFYITTKEDKKRLKNIAISVERWFQLGRLLDVDVRSENGAISRSELSFTERKCFVCDNRAHICIRMQRHHFWEIESYFRHTVIDYLYAGSREESFAKIFVFASSVEYYKYLEFITKDSWKISMNEKEFRYLSLISRLYSMIRKNSYNLNKEEDIKKLYREIINAEDDFNLVNKDTIYIILKFLKAYKNKRHVSFKELLNDSDDILRVVTLSESVNEKKDIKEGLYIVIQMLIREKSSFNLSEGDISYLRRLIEEKDRKRIREFIFNREDLFSAVYNMSILSLVLLLIENTDKEVGDYDY